MGVLAQRGVAPARVYGSHVEGGVVHVGSCQQLHQVGHGAAGQVQRQHVGHVALGRGLGSRTGFWLEVHRGSAG